ncbi:type VI secretion system baseplate subunit TssE [Massilia sp. METH4]|uniref:type VI secretion system baseplate subunit TssE n=1 Tax=Massilia sp. METH4 TaxID=3123041 RepID=UPI0030CBFBD4
MRQAGSTFTPSVWQRLTAPATAATLTLDQHKRAITRDLENLLNTRTAIPEDDLLGRPLCRRSILNFGLADFAQLSLSSSADRKDVCDQLETAIARHEPRLCGARVHLVHEPGVVNRLSFVVTAQLRMQDAGERVRFDVMLEPSTLHYSIR